MNMPATKPISKQEYEALAAFRYAIRQFLRVREEAARQVGITPQQQQALLAIKGFPGRDTISIGEMAERLQIRHHSAVGLVDRLESQGLVSRTHGEDRRFVYVGLTKKGEDILHQLTAPHRDEILQIGENLDELMKHLRLPLDGNGNGNGNSD
jgi:DNA-binding MarR family transcriptional regulator